MRPSFVASATKLLAGCGSLGLAHLDHSPSRALTSEGSQASLAMRNDDLNYTGTAEAAIDAMNQFYNETEGRWQPELPWWLSGYALQDILDYMFKTGSRKYMQIARHTIDLQKEPLPWWPQGNGYFRADSTDDTAWW